MPSATILPAEINVDSEPWALGRSWSAAAGDDPADERGGAVEANMATTALGLLEADPEQAIAERVLTTNGE